MGHLVHVVTPLSFAWKFCTLGIKHIGSQVTTCTNGCCKIQFRRREWCKLICMMNHFMIPKMKKYNYDFLNTADWYRKELANPLLQKMAKNWLKGQGTGSPMISKRSLRQKMACPSSSMGQSFPLNFLGGMFSMAKIDGKFQPFRAAWLSHRRLSGTLKTKNRTWSTCLDGYGSKGQKKSSNRFNVGIHGYGICKLSDFKSSTINETLQNDP